MNRKPVVAGQFYPGTYEGWKQEVDKLVSGYETKDSAILSMVPHAGYVYSGAVAGRTLAQAGLKESIILLGPNHTGRGKAVAVWDTDSWLIPGTKINIDIDLAAEIKKLDNVQPDTMAHALEHSLEVLLPFIKHLKPEAQIVPICIALPNLDRLLQLGKNLANIISSQDKEVSLVVSSDMSHFLNQEQTKSKDEMALQQIMNLNPSGLFQTVCSAQISMCGMLPMVVGLQAALELGATKAKLVQYATSGDITGDYNRVVGYAGILLS